MGQSVSNSGDGGAGLRDDGSPHEIPSFAATPPAREPDPAPEPSVAPPLFESYVSPPVLADLAGDRYSRAVEGVPGARVVGDLARRPRYAGVLAPRALAYAAAVYRRSLAFPARHSLAGVLAHRLEKAAAVDAAAERLAAAGGDGDGDELRDVRLPDGTVALGEREDLRAVREDPSWRVRELPERFRRFHDTIGGPPTVPFVAEALACGAHFCMVDFEDCSTVRFDSWLEGMRAVALANARALDEEAEVEPERDAAAGPRAGPAPAPETRRFRVLPDTSAPTDDGRPAEMLVRVEGLHLPQAHLLVDGRPLPAHLATVCLYLFHNWRALLSRGSVPAFYLPKLERYEEGLYYAALFRAAEEELLRAEPEAAALGYRAGTLLCMVIVENVHAAYEREELLHALRDYAGGLNTGWHDYMASIGAVHARLPRFNMPPKSNLAIVRDYLLAYQVALVDACRRRGAVPVGGMNGMVPTPACAGEVRAAFEADFRAQTGRGLEGVWMGHPGNAPAMRELVRAWRPVPRERVDELFRGSVTHANLVVTRCGAAPPTLADVERLMSDALQYLASYISGSGCVRLTARMAGTGTPVRLTEDAATLERSRREVWALAAHGKPVLRPGEAEARPFGAEEARTTLARVAARVCGRPYDVPCDGRTKISYDAAVEACERLFFDPRPTEYFTALVLEQCLEPFVDHPALRLRSALRGRHPFLALPNVAPECGIEMVTNQAFAPASNLLKPMDAPGTFPAFRPHSFGPQGQVYDGWETARHNIRPPDWVELRPPRPLRVRGVNVDTAHFNGNHAVAAGVQGLVVRTLDYQRQAEEWVDLVPRRATRGNSRHYWVSECDEPVRRVRLTSWPDGGIARLELFGEYASEEEEAALLRWPRPVQPYVSELARAWVASEVPAATGFPDGFVPNPVVEIDDDGPAAARAASEALLRGGGEADVACFAAGARVVASSSSHYSRPENIIKEAAGVNMGDGWETIRMRPDSEAQLFSLVGPVPRYNWTLVRLGAESRLLRCLVDTRHFRNNAPVCYSLEAARAPGLDGSNYFDPAVRWHRVVPPTPLLPHNEQTDEVDASGEEGGFTHVLVKIYPCGGLSRLRVFGEPLRLVGEQ